MAGYKSSPTRCFIDTNIWLYAFIDTQDNNKQAVAKQTIQENEAIVSTQVVNETCVNLLKKAQLSEQDIQALIVSYYNQYAVIEMDQDILLTASELREQYSLAFWDSLIVASALQAQCEILYSEDMHHGLQVGDKLTIKNPFNE